MEAVLLDQEAAVDLRAAAAAGCGFESAGNWSTNYEGCGVTVRAALERSAQTLSIEVRSGASVIVFCEDGAGGEDLTVPRLAEMLAHDFGLAVCYVNGREMHSVSRGKKPELRGNADRTPKAWAGNGTGRLASVQPNQVEPFLPGGDRSKELQAHIDSLRKDHDLVMLHVDSPTLARSAALIGVAQKAVLLVDAGRTTKSQIRASANWIKRSNGVLLGTILTGRRFPIPAWLMKLFHL
jgi:hypothetical protein